MYKITNKQKGVLFLSAISLATGIGLSSFIINNSISTESEAVEGSADPVAYINSPDNQFLTLKGALDAAQSGDIVSLIPPTDANYNDESNKATPDKKVYTLYKDAEVKDGVTLIIPVDQESLSSVNDENSLNDYINQFRYDSRPNSSKGSLSSYSKFATDNEDAYLRTTLIIDDEVTLTNNGTIVVGGYLGGGTSNAGSLGQVSHSYSQIIMGNGAKIVQEENDSSNIYCFGYIREEVKNNSSSIKINKGNVYLPFIVNDFRGFPFSWSMTKDAMSEFGAAPFNQFELRNIEPLITYGYNSSLFGMINVYVYYDASLITINDVATKTIGLIGNTDDFLIQFNDATFSYISFKYDEETTVAQLDLYGGAKLNNLKVELSLDSQRVDLTTENSFFPISYKYNLSLNKNTNLGQSEALFDASNQDIKFLPGSKISINDGVQFNSKNISIYSSFYDGSLGNGSSISNNGYSSVSYPLLPGAEFIIKGNSHLSTQGIGGTLYCDNTEVISYSSNNVLSREAWSYGPDGGLTPPWNIDEYLEIREMLNVVPTDFLQKQKFYAALNSFYTSNSFLPSIKLAFDGGRFEEIDKYQRVIFLDDEKTYEVEPVNNILKINNYKTPYKLNTNIDIDSNNPFLCAYNSAIAISNDNNGINEFLPQSMEITIETPLVDGKPPLYVGYSIELAAHVVDYDKLYDKTITWTSLNPDIATVDSNGLVTGKQLGNVVIQAKCNDLVQSINLEVIEAGEIKPIESLKIVDNQGNTSKGAAGELPDAEYTEGGVDIKFNVEIEPSNANYGTISWSLLENKRLSIVGPTDQTTFTIHIDDSGNTTPDKSYVTCEITQLDGTTISERFDFTHMYIPGCFEKGTVVQTKKGKTKVENIQKNDLILSFNHFTGKYEYKPIAALIEHGEKVYQVIELYFDDDSYIGFIENHGLFDLTLNKYVDFTLDNCFKYIGHKFIKYENNKEKVITLTKVKINEKLTNSYTLVSSENLNCVANNLLNLTTILYGIYNIFDYDENHCFIKEQVENDLAKYGAYNYEDFKGKINEKIFIDYGFKYFKVAIGKGILTEDILDFYINWLFSCIKNGEAKIY